jgi:hypothetical protein
MDTQENILRTSTEEIDFNQFDFASLIEESEKSGLVEDEVETGEDQKEEIIEDTEVIENEEGDESQPSILKTVFEHLHDEGVLKFDKSLLDKEDLSEEDINTVFSSEVDRRVEEKLGVYSNPQVKEFMDFLEKGGQPYQFLELNNEVDLTQIEFDSIKDDEESQEAVIRYYFEKRDFTAEEIEDEIKMYKDTGVLESKAQKSLEAAKKLQVKEKEDKAAALIKENKIKQDEAEKAKTEIITNIDSTTELMGIKFTDEFKKGFKKFIFDDTNNVKNELNKKENFIKLALLAYTKFDLNKLSQVAEAKVKKSLSEKLSTSSGTLKTKAPISTKTNNTLKELEKLNKIL